MACSRHVYRIRAQPELAARHPAAESYRDGGKIKKRTIANLSHWPTEIVEGLRTLLKGGRVAAADQETIVVRRALPHGHVAAVLGTLRDIGLIVCSGLLATAAATSSSR